MANQNTNAVARHPQYKQIIDDILAGKSVREIAKRTVPPVSHATIQRLKKDRLFPALQQAAELAKFQEANGQEVVPYKTAASIARQVVSADYFFERIEKKYSRYDRNIAKAEHNEDFKSVAALDNAETRTLQLHAELAGLLNSAPQVTTNVQVIVMPTKPVDDSGEIIDVERIG